METAVEEAKGGASRVSIRPVARNASAIATFHHLGFRTLGHLDMLLDLEPQQQIWNEGIEVHKNDFRY